MTKIDVAQNLLQLDGTTPLDYVMLACNKCGRPMETQPFTLRLACTTALVVRHEDERQLDIAASQDRYHLAVYIQDTDIVDLTADDVVLIKDLVAKMRSPLVVGQVSDILDPPD